MSYLNVFSWFSGWQTAQSDLQQALDTLEEGEGEDLHIIPFEIEEEDGELSIRLEEECPKPSLDPALCKRANDLAQELLNKSLAKRHLRSQSVYVMPPVMDPPPASPHPPVRGALEKAWHRDIQEIEHHIRQRYYLDDASSLAMDPGDELLVTLDDGTEVLCSNQALIDMRRFQETTTFQVEKESVDTNLSEEGRRYVYQRDRAEISNEMRSILSKVWNEVGRDQERFLKATRLLNQTPQNVMGFDQLRLISETYGFTLALDQDRLQRGFYLFSETHPVTQITTQKVMTTLLGVALKGTWDETGFEVYGTEEQPLFKFYGVTIVNLDNNSAVVHMHLDLGPGLLAARV